MATVTSPTPDRSAPRAARTAAPLFPGEPELIPEVLDLLRPEHFEADIETVLEWCSGRTTVKALDTLLAWHGLSKNQASKLQKARVLWNSFRSAVA